MLTQTKSKWLGKQQDISHPTGLHLHATFTHLAHSTAPLHFTSNDSVTSQHLEEKGTYTKWTTFKGLLFSSPRTFTTSEERQCYRLWSRGNRKGNAAVWSRGRRGRKEVWSITLQDGSRPICHHRGAAGLNQREWGCLCISSTCWNTTASRIWLELLWTIMLHWELGFRWGQR